MTNAIVQAKLSGKTLWELLEKPQGRMVQQGGEHSNFITDAGLNAFATETVHPRQSTGTINEQQPFGSFRNVLWVGTGSNLPAPGDTTLTNPIKGNFSNGGFWAEQSSVCAVSNGVLTLTSRQVRVVDIVTAANLTEYSLHPVGASASASIRELFRDAQGNPVTIAAQPGQQIKLTHDFVISVPWAATPTTLNLGNGAKNANKTFYSTTATQSDYEYAMGVMVGGIASTNINFLTVADAGGPTANSANTLVTATHSLLPYVTGSFQRTKRVVVDPANGNAAIHGFLFRPQNATNSGFKLAYNGATEVKTNTMRLTLDLTIGWGRG